MTFVSLGLATALAWFIVVNAVASLLVAMGAATIVERRFARAPVTLALLRLAPSLTATLFVVLWVAPAYWQLEPRHAAEPVGLTLAALAVVTALLVLTSAYRAVSAIVQTLKTTYVWTLRSTAFKDNSSAIAMYEDSDTNASVSLIGVMRPRLFIGRRVRAALTSDELGAVVAHELAHRSSLDNLTRLLFASCHDVLSLTRAGRALERCWKAAAEESADSRALAGDRRTALHLASALVKVARLIPNEAKVPVLSSSLHEVNERALLPLRVRRLLAPEPPAAASSLPPIVLAVAAIVCAIVAAPVVRPFVHEATELLVRVLP